MPGPVVNGVRRNSAPASAVPASEGVVEAPFLPLLAEGTIKLLLLCSGQLVMARLRNTTDRDGAPAYQLLRPLEVQPKRSAEGEECASGWMLAPFLLGLTSQPNLVLFKGAVASILEPEPRLIQAYTTRTNQECPPKDTPVERLKRAFQEFTESIEA
ncbi:MAG: DUF6561 domain-containing protein [Synechococcus sp.]|nr:DUF6561 domain-containing protein [Synechococcus sp.]